MSCEHVAVVTGASSGIGRATFDLFTKQGWRTVGLARRFSNTPSTRRVDVDRVAEVEKVFHDLLKEHGRIDVLVNCAGITSMMNPLEIPVAEWEKVFRTNVFGTYLCCQQVLPAMCERRFGKIVNVSSIAGRFYSQSASVAYTASKYAVIGITRQLAGQFAAHGVNINCVCPSQTATEMFLNNVSKEQQERLTANHPMKRLAKPEEVAEAIAFLTSDKASYINGAVLDVNGGLL